MVPLRLPQPLQIIPVMHIIHRQPKTITAMFFICNNSVKWTSFQHLSISKIFKHFRLHNHKTHIHPLLVIPAFSWNPVITLSSSRKTVPPKCPNNLVSILYCFIECIFKHNCYLIYHDLIQI